MVLDMEHTYAGSVTDDGVSTHANAAVSERLQAVLDAATNVSIIAGDLSGTITLFNAGAERMLGYRSEEVVGKATPALFHLESEIVARGLELTAETGKPVAGFDVFVEKVGKGQAEEREWTFVRKDGGHLTVNLTVTTLTDARGTIIGFLGVAMDVTARKKAEAAARASDEHFRLIVEAIHDYALIMLDERGYIASWNTGAERVKGYRAEEIIGRHFSTFYLPEDVERHHPDEELRFAARDGRYSEEGWRVRKDGSTFLADVVIAAIYNDDGKVRGFAKVVRDITERKKAEKMMRDQALILDLASDAIFIRDGGSRVTYWNQGAERLYGWSRAEAMGQITHSLLATRFPQPLEDMEAQLLGSGHWSGELEHTRRDGSRVVVASTWTLQRGEAGLDTSVLEINYDITVRKEAEREASEHTAQLRAVNQDLAIREERLDLLLTSTAEGIYAIDLDGNCTFANPACARLLGYSSENELLGRQMHALCHYAQEDLVPIPKEDCAIYRAYQQKAQVHRNTEVFWRKDGSCFAVEYWSHPLYKGSAALGAVVTFIDISQQRAAQKALRRYQEELERRVGERTADLAAANEVLGRSNLELQQFAYIASHDLQSPLRSISGFVQLLSAEYTGKLDEQADGWIRRTVQAIESMQALIRDLLAYSRVDSRSRPFEATPFQDVFTGALSMLESSIHDSGGQVTCGELPVVMGDRAQLVQLMQNLIGNGLKYHAGTPPRVHVSAERRDKEWLFSVSDNGIGIPVQYHAHVFEIFKRLHDQKEYPGTGIGLAVCSRVVNRHGGRIWVKPEPGPGATFHFTIPEGTKTDK